MPARRGIRLLKFAIGLAVGLTLGCAPAAAQVETPRRGGVLDYAIGAEPPNYDCHATGSYAVVHLLAPHYSTLLKVDLAHYPELVGDLAESWSVSEDGLTYRFTLRQGVLFHDGTPLGSADVKATYERLRDPPPGVLSVRKAQFDDIERIETPDARTVLFRLKTPNAGMLRIFASPWNCVYSAALLARDPAGPARSVVGTGPFRFVEHVQGSHWVGERFDRYFRPGLPHLDGFRAIVFSQPSAMLNALQGGQVKAEFRSLAPAERDRLKQTLGDRLRIEEAIWVVGYLLAFNVERKPFDDPRVRRALSLAIDRRGGEAGLARTTTLKGVGLVVPPGSVHAPSEAELAAYPGFGTDIKAAREEARRLLREAGVPNLTFTLTNLSVAQPRVPAGVFLIDQWRQIGVTVQHRQIETAAFNAALGNGGFEVVLDFVSEFMDEPNLLLVKYLSSDRSPANPTRAIDRTLDALFDAQKGTADLAARNALLRQFEARLLDQANSVPFLWTQRIVPTYASVRGWRMSPSHLLGQDLAEVWLAP